MHFTDEIYFLFLLFSTYVAYSFPTNNKLPLKTPGPFLYAGSFHIQTIIGTAIKTVPISISKQPSGNTLCPEAVHGHHTTPDGASLLLLTLFYAEIRERYKEISYNLPFKKYYCHFCQNYVTPLNICVSKTTPKCIRAENLLLLHLSVIYAIIGS